MTWIAWKAPGGRAMGKFHRNWSCDPGFGQRVVCGKTVPMQPANHATKDDLHPPAKNLRCKGCDDGS